jgi:hypothetical protein
VPVRDRPPAALRWADLNLTAGSITIGASMGRDGIHGPPKTKAGLRVVPVVPALRRLLVAGVFAHRTRARTTL